LEAFKSLKLSSLFTTWNTPAYSQPETHQLIYNLKHTSSLKVK